MTTLDNVRWRFNTRRTYMPTLERLKAVECLGGGGGGGGGGSREKGGGGNEIHAPCAGVCYNKISSIMSAYCRVCFTIKAEKTFPGLLLKTRKIY